MSTLSIFIDESGDFGMNETQSPYYIFSLVFHDQKDIIKDLSDNFKLELTQLGFKKPYFHAGPILRKEEDYKYYQKSIRVRSFNKMIVFIKKLPIKYTTIEIDKRTCKNPIDLSLQLSKKLRQFISSNLGYFQKFDHLKLYYDNGQITLSKVLKLSFESFFNQIEEKFDADPRCYTLFQVADALTTLKLVSLKYLSKKSSRTELEFFGNNYNLFNKNYLAKITNKRL